MIDKVIPGLLKIGVNKHLGVLWIRQDTIVRVVDESDLLKLNEINGPSFSITFDTKQGYNESVPLARSATVVFLLCFQSVFPKDILVMIGKCIYNTRYETCTWKKNKE